MSPSLGAFPQPPETRSIQLPTGASLTGMVELPKGMDEQCRVAFNLMLQLGPFLTSIQCLIEVLQFVFDAINFAKAVPEAIKLPKPNPAAMFEAIGKLVADGEKLAECFGWMIPAIPLCQFVEDILTMIHDFIGCLLELLDSILSQQLELNIKMGDAQGNPELLAVLNLARKNLDATAAQGMQSMAPVFSLLQIIGGFLELIGVPKLALPSMDQLSGGTLEEGIQPIKDFNDVLGAVIEALPC